MAPPTEKIGFIGAGRLGCGLAWSLDASGCVVHAVASRSTRNTARLSDRVKQCSVSSAQGVADACDLIFVTTPDAAIQSTVEAIQWRPGTGVVHCSGATEVSALNKALGDGALIGGFHPLQTFGDPQAAAETLKGCVITIEARPKLIGLLTVLAAQLGCRTNELPPGARGTYHAAAAFASQHINVLLAEAVRMWTSWGASEEAAMHALLPLARGTLFSIETAGVGKSMPGPVSRGDKNTIEKHLHSLASIDHSAAALYKQLCFRSIPLAEQCGAIDSDMAIEIRRILSR